MTDRKIILTNPYTEVILPMNKAFLSLLLFFSFTIHQAKALDIRDAYGRTELMNFIRQAEQEIKHIKADIDRLWHVCFEKRQYSDGVEVKVETNIKTGSQTTQVIPKYRYETVRRASCTDADVHAYKARCQDLPHAIARTVDTMKYMATSQELYLNATDSWGYTAQNYCYTYEIYQELHRQGAAFQYVPYMYFHPGLGTLATAAAIVGTYCVIGGIVAGTYHATTRINSSYHYQYR